MIFQENIITTVERKENHLTAKTILINKELEIIATLIVNIHSFLIEDAFCEILKIDSTSKTSLKVGIHQYEELTGKIGYIEGKKILKCLLNLQEGKLLKYLFAQCINGFIQAETYVSLERGFQTKEKYNLYWDLTEQNGCRMYCHPNEADLKWMDYVPPLIREKTLFNRIQNYRINKENSDIYHIAGTFSDSFHEINVEIVFLKSSGIISHVDIEFFRAPGLACFENRLLSNEYMGKNIYQMDKKQIIACFGGGEGCYHLTEIMLEIRSVIDRVMLGGGYDD